MTRRIRTDHPCPRQLTKAEIDKRWPLAPSLPSQTYRHNRPVIDIDDPEVMASLRIVGKMVEVRMTRDRYEELPIGYAMHPVPPNEPGKWYIFDNSCDHRTKWGRDMFLIVEAQS
jgi:hypothetical protein